MKKPNKLKGESSPYLIQHLYNPVDWRPWGEDAFKTAEAENKPVFISIGYSTCHWCHVMAHESFEDENIAELLNANFVCVKIDREEYPEVDHYYMEACQILTGRGGWPLTIFADKNKKPFYAGTYFPKDSSGGRVGFRDLLLRIIEVWKGDYQTIETSIKEINLSLNGGTGKQPGQFDESIFHTAYRHFENSFDYENGGFGSRPKFPSPHNLLFMLRYWYHFKEGRSLEMVEKTVENICSGGIYDHIGGGFHRYSTDNKWLLPHFEKMLYDQAMMVIVLSELYKITGKEIYRYYIETSLEFVLEEMKSPEGAFYSAFDADSDGEEGKYYVWTYEELTSILSGDEVRFLEKYFGIRSDGNFSEEHSGRTTGKNILHFDSNSLNEFGRIAGEFKPVRKKLLLGRRERIAPLLDNKILTDWNGLMIYALTKAYTSLNKAEYLEAAERAFEWIMNNHFAENKYIHSSTDGIKKQNSILDDYAFMGMAGASLFELTGKPVYLTGSLTIAKTLVDEYYNAAYNSFRLSNIFLSGSAPNVFDNAYPSGNSAAFHFLSRFSHLIKTGEYDAILRGLSESIPYEAAAYPFGATYLLETLFNLNFSFREVILVGVGEMCPQPGFGLPEGKYEPDKGVLRVNSGNIKELSAINDFFAGFAGSIEKITHGTQKPYLINCDENGCSLPEQI